MIDPQALYSTNGQEAWRVLGIMAEFQMAADRLNGVRQAVSLFGSARTKDDHPYYATAKTNARKLSDAGFSVISGGGPGLMQAANHGAHAGRAPAIGLNIVFKKDRVPELRKMARLGKIPMRGDGWNADYPDAENFMQLLYGPHAAQENQAQFDLPEFNDLYQKARLLPDSPERTKLFDRMTQLVIAYAPWRLTYHLLEDSVRHKWVKTYVPHPIRSTDG